MGRTQGPGWFPEQKWQRAGMRSTPREVTVCRVHRRLRCKRFLRPRPQLLARVGVTSLGDGRFSLGGASNTDIQLTNSVPTAAALSEFTAVPWQLDQLSQQPVAWHE